MFYGHVWKPVDHPVNPYVQCRRCGTIKALPVTDDRSEPASHKASHFQRAYVHARGGRENIPSALFSVSGGRGKQMLTIKDVYRRSWLDPRSVRQVAAAFHSRLTKRVGKKRMLFVTLTYDQRLFDSPLDAYRTSSEHRHIPRFIERLSKQTGIDLTGRWIRKLEFQDNSWPHYHLLIDTHRYIDQKVIEECWGHGYARCERMKPSRIAYFCKYVSKTGTIPAWLLGERPKSVKIVACSPGWWGERARRTEIRSRRSLQLACYVPIGQRLSTVDGVVVRVPESDSWHFIRLGMSEVLDIASDLGTIVDCEKEAYIVDADPARLIERLRTRERAAKRHAPFGLSYMTNPPNLPCWFVDYFIATGVAA